MLNVKTKNCFMKKIRRNSEVALMTIRTRIAFMKNLPAGIAKYKKAVIAFTISQ